MDYERSKYSILDLDVCGSFSKGYICEFTIQKCKSIDQLERPNFIIVPPPSDVSETVNFEEAKNKCSSLQGYRSSSWRLLRFTNQTQQLWYARLQQLLEANCLTEMSWWVDFENGFEKYKFDKTMSKGGIFEILYYTPLIFNRNEWRNISVKDTNSLGGSSQWWAIEKARSFSLHNVTE